MYNCLKFCLLFLAIMANDSYCYDFLNEKPSFFTENQGTKLPVFIDVSDGEPVILVHGGPGLPGYMKSLSKFVKDHTVIRYYQREALLSKSKGPYTVKDHVEDLLSVVNIVKNKYGVKPKLIAHSFGTLVTLEFLKKYGSLVSRVVLISVAELFEETSNEFVNNFINVSESIDPLVFKKARGMRYVYEKMDDDNKRIEEHFKKLELFWPSYFSNLKTSKDLLFAPAEYRHSNKTRDDYLNKVASGEFRLHISNIKNKVVHLHGDKDILPYKRTKGFLEKKLNHYQFNLIQNAGHFPWLEPKAKNSFKELINKHLSP